MNNIKAAIFDLDGTLVDSMWVWEQIDIDFLNSKGYTPPKDLKNDITHLTFNQTAEYFKNRFNLPDSIDEITTTWHNMAYDFYSSKVKLKPGVIPFFNKLKSLDIKIGLATSNSIPLLEATLKNNGIYHLFDAITVTEEVKKSKENPDVYLLCANKLNIAPENCVVFEDIIAAVKGAKLAGMKVIGVYDKSSEDQEELLTKACDKYIYNYNELV
ncbi:Phosphorylated carbohydrates phosphatase TM_1254 [uncultured Clostridium sp.]|uniref:HAD family hydrolase n=1 Tax=uncultured Clostridium sp. TaxID=59620 RepID=UPI0008234EBB|nr:HAD family phosphatase [uncultured Clostridium sp.]SCJ30765.1 Phosphorylated carbohydrates phosphatase TM_1254 [uncultured Clostridium sp.]